MVRTRPHVFAPSLRNPYGGRSQSRRSPVRTGTHRYTFEETVMRHAIRHRPPLTRRALIAIAVDIALALTAQPAWADCFDDAGAYQRVNPMVLRAIAWQE